MPTRRLSALTLRGINSTPTILTLLLTDVVSLGSAFALLPKMLPHPPTAHASATGWRRIVQEPTLLHNVALAAGWATFSATFLTYVTERVGGMSWIKAQVRELTVPSYFSHDTLTPVEMLAVSPCRQLARKSR